ncbi:MAG TPA: hypothetical protein VIY48_18975 [Candidatus Paceibacterota bacterium]
MTAERKYTDRDVRENPELEKIALNYLKVYGGDFEPLVNAQGLLAAGHDLPTNIIRVVLNCMRHDRDYAADMPAPEAKVIEMVIANSPEKKQKHKKKNWCKNTAPHRYHWEGDGADRRYCQGITNGRPQYLFIDARIKPHIRYALAKHGTVVHMIEGEGHHYTWYPNQYGDGYAWSLDSDAELTVNLLCRYPSRLREPMLLDRFPDNIFTPRGVKIELCPHCKKIATQLGWELE